MFDLTCGLRLRAFQPPPASDLDSILGIYNNTQVAPLITHRFIVPRGEQIKEEFKEIIDKKAEMFCIIETIPSPSPIAVGEASSSDAREIMTSKPQFVGFTALWGNAERGHRHSDYSIVLMPEFWNKGYGQAITKFMVHYAFLHLNMHRISLVVYEGNERAIAVYKKIGFINEGRQRKARWCNGAWSDIIQMGILMEDWTEMRSTER
ncbi:acyl-CoA N-acyltransferase [Flammula alnicola]|nr:acyl-CoA N-acyltransferase [Flammula alnicola]